MRPTKLGAVRHNVGRRIAELRIERDLTQAWLAERAGMSLRYLQTVEAGTENLGLDSLVRFANLFDVSVSDLFRQAKTERAGRGRPARAKKRDLRRKVE